MSESEIKLVRTELLLDQPVAQELIQYFQRGLLAFTPGVIKRFEIELATEHSRQAKGSLRVFPKVANPRLYGIRSSLR